MHTFPRKTWYHGAQQRAATVKKVIGGRVFTWGLRAYGREAHTCCEGQRGAGSRYLQPLCTEGAERQACLASQVKSQHRATENSKCSPSCLAELLLTALGQRGGIGRERTSRVQTPRGCPGQLPCPRLAGLASHTLPGSLPLIPKPVGIHCRHGQQ